MKKLYLLSQNVNNGYDTYDSCVVCATSEDEARTTNPGGFRKWHDGTWWFQFTDGKEEKGEDHTWCLPDDVKVEEIGEANDDVALGVVCASFNAG